MKRLLSRVVDVRPEEVRATLLAALFFFFVLSSYFILRPIRDAMGVAAGVSKLPLLFLGTLGAMLVAQPLYAALVARTRVRRFIPVTYHFFAANLLIFFALQRFGSAAWGVWSGRVFFVWTSVFSLFVPSVFWSFMVDHFTPEQGRRLFGFIGVGGTTGSLLGSAITATLARAIGPDQLLPLSALLVELAVVVLLAFPARPARIEEPAHVPARPLGGSAWDGFRQLLSSSYLSGIAGFLFLYTLGSTILYFQQADVVGKTFATPGARTQVLAQLELGAQLLTLVTQLFFTGRIIRKAGVALTLMIMPAVSVLGFAALGMSGWRWLPLFGTLAAFTILRRGSNFSLTNPAMEVLFTVVDRSAKYKAKSFLETFVYRAGDQLAAWSYSGLTALGMSLGGIAWLAVPASAAFCVLGAWLGKRQAALAREREPAPHPGLGRPAALPAP
ncbi:MAG TPA: MFS transporter [Myxococcaceae bacterium]|nr:MFS transporter [Myxococcaceae bacterium]